MYQQQGQPAYGEVVQGQPYQYQQQQNIPQYPEKPYTPTSPATPSNNVNTPLVGGYSENGQHLEQGVPLYADYCNNSNNAGGVNVAAKFVVQGYKDIWAAVLFILLTLALIGVGSYNFQHNFSAVRDTTDNLATHTWGDFHPGVYFGWAGIGVAIGAASGILSLGIFYCAPQVSIIAANVLVAVFFVGIGIIYIRLQALYPAIVMFIVAALRLLILYIYRKHIPISGLVLKQATILAKRQPMTTIIAFMTLIGFAAWFCFSFATAYPTISDAWSSGDDNTSTGAIIGMWFFFLFATFWASQVAFNVGHTTFCGVTATWYFCGQDTMPSNPTLHSAKRALTTSFGSICFGSLLVAILRTIRYMVRSAAGSRGFCACIALCFLSCLESLVRLFNHYAYAYVAIYGCDFVDGAKKTMNLITTSPYLVLFNNLLVNGMLVMFSLVVSVAVGVGSFYVSKKQQIDDPNNAGREYTDGDYWFPYSLIFALIAAVACLITTMQMFRVIDSTSTTLLVCLSEEPQLIFSTNPEFANELAARAADAGINVMGGNVPMAIAV